jgi:hypothetical protein
MATPVAPRTTEFAWPNSTRVRLGRGTKGTLAAGRCENREVRGRLIVVVTLELIDEMHWPLIGLVLQRLMASSKAQEASFCAVAGSATTSGTGVAEADSRKV